MWDVNVDEATTATESNKKKKQKWKEKKKEKTKEWKTTPAPRSSMNNMYLFNMNFGSTRENR